MPVDSTPNARITSLGNGLTQEMIAEQTHLKYNPGTGSGTVSFQARPSLYINNQYTPLKGGYDVLTVDVDDIVARCFGQGLKDPVTGADLSRISGAGMTVIIKAAYDILFNERAKTGYKPHNQVDVETNT